MSKSTAQPQIAVGCVWPLEARPLRQCIWSLKSAFSLGAEMALATRRSHGRDGPVRSPVNLHLCVGQNTGTSCCPLPARADLARSRGLMASLNRAARCTSPAFCVSDDRKERWKCGARQERHFRFGKLRACRGRADAPGSASGGGEEVLGVSIDSDARNGKSVEIDGSPRESRSVSSRVCPSAGSCACTNRGVDIAIAGPDAPARIARCRMLSAAARPSPLPRAPRQADTGSLNTSDQEAPGSTEACQL